MAQSSFARSFALQRKPVTFQAPIGGMIEKTKRTYGGETEIRQGTPDYIRVMNQLAAQRRTGQSADTLEDANTRYQLRTVYAPNAGYGRDNAGEAITRLFRSSAVDTKYYEPNGAMETRTYTPLRQRLAAAVSRRRGGFRSILAGL